MPVKKVLAGPLPRGGVFFLPSRFFSSQIIIGSGGCVNPVKFRVWFYFFFSLNTPQGKRLSGGVGLRLFL